MRHLLTTSIISLVSVCCLGLASLPLDATAQDPPQVTKIGTFDSRAVALAFWRSEAGMAVVNSIQDELRAAREAGDEDRVRELEAKGPGLQIRMMQQVFSTGTVTDVLRRVEDLIPSIAEKAGVPLVVSKWQVIHQNPSVESVDVTMELVSLFSPTDDILARVGQILGTDPVPIDELPMDPRR